MDDSWLKQASKRRRYLVGVSGGADSVALLEMLITHGFQRLVVCHLDHGWRGRESRADARFVKRLAQSHGLDLEIEAAQLPQGGSMEARAREARHAFFARCAARWRCPRLLLAHHAEDQAETVLWNLLRGSHGACGMEPSRHLTMAGRRIEVIRPLLNCRRDDLRAWLHERGMRWREDSTNTQPIAVRNRLRHEALPLLAEISGRDAVGAIVRAAATDDELREIEAWAVREAAAIDPQGRLHLGRLSELPPALRRACLHAFLSAANAPGPSRAELDRVMAMLEPGGPPRVSLAGGGFARRRAGRLWVD